MESDRSAIPISFSSENAFLTYLDELHELSAFDSSVEVGEGDRIVSFCVSLQDSSDDRLLLVSCKLVDDSASAAAEETSTDATEAAPAETAESTAQPDDGTGG